MKIKLSNKQKHILLWLWSSDHPNADKDDFFTEHPDFGHPLNDCFACQAAGITDHTPVIYCDTKCPMLWAPKKVKAFNYCCGPESYYMLWNAADSEKDRAKYARKIVALAIKTWTNQPSGLETVDIDLTNKQKFILMWTRLADYPDMSPQDAYREYSDQKSGLYSYACDEVMKQEGTLPVNCEDLCPISWPGKAYIPCDKILSKWRTATTLCKKMKYARKIAIRAVKTWK